jgi:hypothetical protein
MTFLALQWWYHSLRGLDLYETFSILYRRFLLLYIVLGTLVACPWFSMSSFIQNKSGRGSGFAAKVALCDMRVSWRQSSRPKRSFNNHRIYTYRLMAHSQHTNSLLSPERPHARNNYVHDKPIGLGYCKQSAGPNCFVLDFLALHFQFSRPIDFISKKVNLATMQLLKCQRYRHVLQNPRTYSHFLIPSLHALFPYMLHCKFNINKFNSNSNFADFP